MSREKPEICIIGAGMSGLLMGIRLKAAGIHSFRIYEKASSVAGTWRENRYPGLSCDVPSFYYSYSFEPNPDWSHRFASGPEIRAYFERVAEKYELLPHIQFGTLITGARREDGRWTVQSEAGDAGETIRADILITACGPLHKKVYPDIDGLESFQGAQFHSADWDDDVELEGRRIGVIGTGSSAVQMMAPLSKVASHLTMFQRTAQWIMPYSNKPYSERWKKWARRLPLIAKLNRFRFRFLFDQFGRAVVESGRTRQQIGDRCRKYLASVEDPELRAKLTPDYEPMCKRLVISRDFYPTLRKEHVELVTEGIDRVETKGIVTLDGKLHELDVMVLATGFDAHAWGVEQIIGEHGLSLPEAWAKGDRAHRSVAFPGFPNFFMLVGPNSPVGNLSLIDVAETQTKYIMQFVAMFQQGKFSEVVPTPEATRKFHESLLAAMKDTVWVTGCGSWYLDADGVPITWPWTAARFRKDLRRPDLSEYELRAV